MFISSQDVDSIGRRKYMLHLFNLFEQSVFQLSTDLLYALAHYLFPFDRLGFQSIILQQAGEFEPQFRQVRVQRCFTSTETVRTVRDRSPGRPPRLSHSSLALRYRTCHPCFNVRVRNSGPPCLAAIPVHHCPLQITLEALPLLGA